MARLDKDEAVKQKNAKLAKTVLKVVGSVAIAAAVGGGIKVAMDNADEAAAAAALNAKMQVHMPVMKPGQIFPGF